MRQRTFVKPGRLEWHDVPRPRIVAETDALVRPVAVGRCDLDLYIATGTGTSDGDRGGLVWSARDGLTSESSGRRTSLEKVDTFS
jgi:threonine dehydrogenase-like Zn-dependent dehydrogenase